jgi:hypothetical protein
MSARTITEVKISAYVVNAAHAIIRTCLALRLVDQLNGLLGSSFQSSESLPGFEMGPS